MSGTIETSVVAGYVKRNVFNFGIFPSRGIKFQVSLTLEEKVVS